MRDVIRHLCERNREEVARSSFVNCHAIGLTSIMLLDQPGKRIRLFVAESGHEMWRNLVTETGRFPAPMSIGFHSHHCDLTLVGVCGSFLNIDLLLATEGEPLAFKLSPFLYKSQISTGVGAFEAAPEHGPRWGNTVVTWLDPGMSVRLPARHFHTVFVPATERAAWLVLEGEEDPGYQPITYSNHDLTQVDFGPLYRRATADDIDRALALALGIGR